MDLESLSPACFFCSSEFSVSKLLAKKAGLRLKKGFVQLFNYDEKMVARILAAYLNAIVRQNDGLMKSNEVSNEMLALLAGEMNISKAIKKVGVKNPKNFILFLTDSKLAPKIKVRLKLTKMKPVKMELDATLSSQVAATPLLED